MIWNRNKLVALLFPCKMCGEDARVEVAFIASSSNPLIIRLCWTKATSNII